MDYGDQWPSQHGNRPAWSNGPAGEAGTASLRQPGVPGQGGPGRGGSGQGGPGRGGPGRGGSGRGGSGRVLGRLVYAVTCVASAVVLVASGFGYFVVSSLSKLGTSHAIDKNAPRSLGNSENILLIGLDSRMNQNGDPLPPAILAKLHAGSQAGVDSGNVGGYNTNTLILLHVPGDGSKATAFSIPRDDYVSYSNAIGPQQQGKIKEAYGITKYYKEVALADKGIHNHRTQETQGREAARRATIATVRKLTGVPIDHFAEINLAGFYDLATALHGVEVCLKHPVNDSFSGAHFPAGKQHLNGAQALAFVRQRHGLDNGDLDRTHRQQAFLSSVTHQLKTQGVFGDLGQMQSLLGVAKKDVVLDAGFDVLSFAQQAQNLTGGNILFHTLPIERYGTATVGGNIEDVNIVNPAAIKAEVQSAFSDSKPAPPTPGHPSSAPHATVDVLNGGGTAGLAARIADKLTGLGYTKGNVGNTATRTRTVVRYGTGTGTDAAKIAKILGARATADSTITAGHVEIDLAETATMPTFPAAPKTAPKPVAIPTDGAQGGAVNAKDGVPCVN